MKEHGRFRAAAALAALMLAACAVDRSSGPDPSDGVELAPLHEAAASGDTATVRALPAGGADIDLRAKGTPLHFAAMFGDPATVRDADTIVALADGRIVESGTHAALPARGGREA